MSFSFSSFTTLLSELAGFPSYLRNRIPDAIIYPFGIVVLSLAAITGYALGLDKVQAAWSSISAWSKLILTAVAVISFFFVAYILNTLRSFVARGFQGDWPAWLERITRQRARHEQIWQQHSDTWTECGEWHSAIKTMKEDFERSQPAQARQVVKARRALPQHSVLTWDDLELLADQQAPQDALGAPGDAVGMLLLRAVAAGEALSSGLLVLPAQAIWHNGTLVMALPQLVEATPGDLPIGKVVTIYKQSRNLDRPINPGGYLITDVTPVQQVGPLRSAARYSLSLAVPAEAATQFRAQATGAQLTVGFRPQPATPLLWGAEPRTRRWVAVPPAMKVGPIDPRQPADDPRPGDPLDLSFTSDGAGPEIKEACFLEAVDGGWALAVRLPDAVKLAELELSAKRLWQASRSIVKVSRFAQPVAACRSFFGPQPDLPGYVCDGRFISERQISALADIVQDARTLGDEVYSKKQIPAGAPIRWDLLGNVDRARKPISCNNQTPGPAHFVIPHPQGETCSVVFHCDVIDGDRVLVPRDLAKGWIREDCLRGTVPRSWTIWRKARQVIWGVAPARVPEPGTGVIWIGYRDANPTHIDQIIGGFGMVSTVAPSLRIIVDRADGAPDGSLLKYLLWFDAAHVPQILERGADPESFQTWLELPMKDVATKPVQRIHEERLALRELTLALNLVTEFLKASGRNASADLSRQRSHLYQELIRIERQTQQQSDEARQRFSLYYPKYKAAVAPTSIGNIMRSVDTYCESVYGLDAALFLPRLQQVLSEKTSQQINDTNEKLELLEWSWIGTIVVGIVGPLIALLAGKPRLGLIPLAVALPLAWIIFNAAKAAALGYADALRIAFDRDRHKVLAALGVPLDQPLTAREEKELWNEVEQWLVFGEPRETLKIKQALDKA